MLVRKGKGGGGGGLERNLIPDGNCVYWAKMAKRPRSYDRVVRLGLNVLASSRKLLRSTPSIFTALCLTDFT